jgi:2-isopropylmalate synthase
VGKAALAHRLNKLGFNLEKEELVEIYEEFLLVADKNKEIYDEDLLDLMGIDHAKRQLELNFLEVTCVKEKPSRAKVEINRNGTISYNEAEGNGPVDAIIKAIDGIMGDDAKLEEYLVQAITGGSDDTAKVHIQISDHGVFHYGFASDTDTVYATAKAYLDALSKV